MSLKRDTLKAMGLTEEQINSIIADHTASIEGIRNTYEAQVTALQAEVDKATAHKTDLDKKYADEHNAFESYKAEIAKRDTDSAKRNLYRSMLAETGISTKRIDAILKMTDLESFELDDKGGLKNADKITASIRDEWAEFIPESSTIGAKTSTPPANNNSDPDSLSDADYYRQLYSSIKLKE